MYNRELIETVVHRIFRLYSNYEKFCREIKTLKSIFKHDDYPQNFANQCINKFLNKLFIKKHLNLIMLSYLGKILFDLKLRLTRTIERDLTYYKLKKNCSGII